MGSKNRRNNLQIENDRQIIKDMYLRGSTQAAIAVIIGVTQQQISNDIKAIQKEWREARVNDLHEAKAKELDRIDALEREYWRQYEESKKPKKSQMETVKSNGDISSTKRIEDNGPDPRYLDGVMNCIQERCRILGLYEEIAGGSQSEEDVYDIYSILDDVRGRLAQRRRLLEEATIDGELVH